METVINSWLNQLDLLLLMMSRVAGIFVLAPIFNFNGLNTTVKVGLSFLFALLVMLSLPKGSLFVPPIDLVSYVLILLKEIIIGISIGFILQLVFAAILTAGQIIDIQLGFGIINIMDPMWGTQVPMTATFMQILALLLFVTYDGHLLLVKTLMDSFNLVPVGGASFSLASSGQLADFIIRLVSGVFLTGVQLAMPIIGVILINDIAMGIVSRTVPQMNLFVIGIPVKILVGVAFLWIILPFYIDSMNRLYEISFSNVLGFLKLLSP
ncbi:flagellar type III secretion system protein FliR [Heliobacillus mobilis]|uniref:Flagellar biosynthetic protein FliR n=1 Tax=Heliobacterium mobile TaxID=28064 RepID=A0A6I3SGD9_HELMO|nr:flagellar biosynthetic protein FliR [Heliobacterium mobile]MTV47811.1 flagellar type III secretion system protein FliR [Heliobacterium mobile]